MSGVINLTSNSPELGVSGFSTDDGLAFGNPSFGSISPAFVDGREIGALYWVFASHGNASVELFLKYTGTPPDDAYVTGLSFTADTGVNNLTPAFETVLETGTSGDLYKMWLFNAVSGLPSQSDPFTANGNVYAITVSTSLPTEMTLDATPVSDAQIDLSWTDSSGVAANYNIYRDGSEITQLANNQFSYNDAGLSPSTLYMYYIIGVDSSNTAVYATAFANATTESVPVAQSVLFLGALNGQQFYTANGNVNVSGNVYLYSEGSLTPCNTYTTISGLTLNPNPIQINVDGYLGNEIWTVAGANVRARIMDSANILQQDLDNLPGIPAYSNVTSISVIDSIFSTDTANAASANAVNWAFNVANLAGTFANTVNNNLANAVASINNISTNTITMQTGGVTVNVGNTINFINTAFANIAVTSGSSNNDFNISIFANAVSQTNSTNSSIAVSGGMILSWTHLTYTKNGDLGPFTDNFSVSFPNACLHAQMTSQGGPGACPLAISSFTSSAITWNTGHGDSPSTGQYIFAVGY